MHCESQLYQLWKAIYRLLKDITKYNIKRVDGCPKTKVLKDGASHPVKLVHDIRFDVRSAFTDGSLRKN